MIIDVNLLVLFIALFAGLVAFIGQGIIRKLQSIDDDLKELLIDHGQRITTLEERSNFMGRRKAFEAD